MPIDLSLTSRCRPSAIPHAAAASSRNTTSMSDMVPSSSVPARRHQHTRRLGAVSGLAYESAHARPNGPRLSGEDIMTTNLGTMEELPSDYRDAVANANTT